MSEFSPSVDALLAELTADPGVASVTFFPVGVHTHMTGNGDGTFNLEVHSTVLDHTVEEEQVISAESSLTADEIVWRMSTLADASEVYMKFQSLLMMDELEAFLADQTPGE